MGRHEIRLRRKKMTSRRIESHKNYYALMKKYERSGLGKRMLRLVILFIIFLGIMLLVYVGWKKLERVGSIGPENSSQFVVSSVKTDNLYTNQVCLCFSWIPRISQIKIRFFCVNPVRIDLSFKNQEIWKNASIPKRT